MMMALAGDRLARGRASNLRQLLIRAARVINQDVTGALGSAGFKDLRNSQVSLLAHIDLDGTSIVDLAERAQISKQAASKLVAELAVLGYLSTAREPSDARALRVQFTPKGHAMMRRSFELFAGLERKYSRHVGAGPYRTLKFALRTLGRKSPT
jgi:DNA-binding MarR family transcriptional regulator